MDKDLKALRNARWERAFHKSKSTAENPLDTVNRKATVVIEHLIQASDVSHTMQVRRLLSLWELEKPGLSIVPYAFLLSTHFLTFPTALARLSQME